MSKQIKVEDQVYNELDQLRGRGETFSQVIANLVKSRLEIFHLVNILEGQLKYAEWKRDRIRGLTSQEEP